MKILVDGYNLALRNGTGVATYGRTLCRGLRRLGHEVDVLYGRDQARSELPLLDEVAFYDEPRPRYRGALAVADRLGAAATAALGCPVDEVPRTGRVITDAMSARLPACDRQWNSRRLYQRAHQAHRWFGRFAAVDQPPVELAHWTYPLPLRHRSAANVYTLHDLVPLRLPYTTLDDKRSYFDLCRRIARQADHIVTVSENSRSDIVNLLGVSPERVTNTYQVVEFPEALMARGENEVAAEVRGIFRLKRQGYFVFFGAIEPKKNLGRLVEAYLASGVRTPLVVVGAPGWGGEDELRLLKAVSQPQFRSVVGEGRASQIVQIEYLPLSLLVSLVRNARATLFPSLYEGFGLPVVESMLLGAPVLTSRTSCLPEVAGGAALLVDPYDTHDIATGIRALDADEALRADLRERGRRRAAYFSSERMQGRLDEAYRCAVGARAGGARQPRHPEAA